MLYPRLIEAVRGDVMQIVCPDCGKALGTVVAAEKLLLTVHCPFDGKDFGVTVEGPDVDVEVPKVPGSVDPPKP